MIAICLLNKFVLFKIKLVNQELRHSILGNIKILPKSKCENTSKKPLEKNLVWKELSGGWCCGMAGKADVYSAIWVPVQDPAAPIPIQLSAVA